jgi:hypothetical protein
MKRLPDSNPTLGLHALAWTVSDADRAERLLAVTGLTPASLRAGAGEPATLVAVLGFLEGHEPDLLACADALGVPPAALVRARAELEA